MVHSILNPSNKIQIKYNCENRMNILAGKFFFVFAVFVVVVVVVVNVLLYFVLFDVLPSEIKTM